LSQSTKPATTFLSLVCNDGYLQPASSNVQLRSGRLSKVLRIWRKRLLHRTTSAAVSLDNLDTTADVQLGLHHRVKLVPDGLEELGVANTLDKVIRLALNVICDEL
jgi:hypothetical protein